MRVSPLALAWTGYLIVALLLLGVVPSDGYPVVVGLGALALGLAVPHTRRVRWNLDRRDLAPVVGLYGLCVGLFYLAFQVFTVDNVPGLFVAFGAGLVLGVAGPVAHVGIVQRRPLSELGLSRERLPATALLAVLLGVVQAALILPTVPFGEPTSWLPLLVMALVVGFFEAVFFRGYVIAIIEPMLGIVPAVAASALLYTVYHVGYGMTGTEMTFLFGLGIVYAIAFALARNLFAIWPVLTPVGGFFASLKAGDISLPMEAILGFADVAGLMAAAIYLVNRWRRRHAAPVGAPSRAPQPS